MPDEKSLYLSCKAGDQQQMKAVFTAYLPLYTALCRRYANNDSDAKDLVQEGFIKIFSSLEKFEWKGKGSFTAWMQRIMINNAITFYNRSAKYIETSIDDMEMELSDAEEADDEVFELTSETLGSLGFEKKDLIAIVQSLPEPYRLVFNMYVIEGKRHKEISKLLGIPEKTSTTRLLRARKLIKKELELRYAHCLQTQ